MLSAVLALVTATWSADLRADAREDLERGKSLLGNGQLEDAVKVFAKLLAEPLDPGDREYKKKREIYQAARPLYATCLVGLGNTAKADAVVLEHLRDDPFYQSAPGELPQQVVDRFIAVRAAHRPELEKMKQRILRERQEAIQRGQKMRDLQAKRLEKLEKMAAEERTIERRSRLVATIPFGVGQLHNGSTGLGVFFATSEVLAIAGAIVSKVIADDLAPFANGCVDKPDPRYPLCTDVETRFTAAKVANWVSFGAAFALITGGIIEAHVSFEPASTTVRKRSIPPPVKVEPTVTPLEQGAMLGVRLRF